MTNKRRIYEFNDYRVDTGQFLLIRRDRTTAITPTVFRILLLLLERAGQIVPKEELIQFVWPDSFVEEGNLNRNISTLRKALEERPSDHRYIETVPKMGYRFVPSVRTLDYQPPAGTARPASAAKGSRIVGREAECNALRGAYDQALQGKGSIVCINGESGFGKTALVEAFLERLSREGKSFHLARSRCSKSLTESENLMPWIEAIGRVAQDPQIRAVLQNVAPNWHVEISHSGIGAPRKMKRELSDFCRDASSVHPLIIVIDDFHWADVASVDLLAFLSTRLESSRALIVVSYRLSDLKLANHSFMQVRPDLLSRGGSIELQLGRLQLKDVVELIGVEYPGNKFPDGYAAILHANTEGHPLFVRELLANAGRLGDSARHMIQQKISHLDDTHRQLLVTAGVQGREFDSAVLARSLNLSAQDVEETLSELADVHGLIERIREEQLSDGKFTVRYRFAYSFYQEVFSESLEPTRKASVNASLAEAFLAYYGN